jgi:hypothetical protein
MKKENFVFVIFKDFKLGFLSVYDWTVVGGV